MAKNDPMCGHGAWTPWDSLGRTRHCPETVRLGLASPRIREAGPYWVGLAAYPITVSTTM